MKSGERREAIIAAAVRLFSEKGFRGATTRELAAALEVTEPVIYQHFETKRDLYRAIIETKARERQQDSEYWHEMENPAGDREFFGAVARLLLQRVERDPSYLRLLLFSALEGTRTGGSVFRTRSGGDLRPCNGLHPQANGGRSIPRRRGSVPMRRGPWSGWQCITRRFRRCSMTP